MHIRLRRPGKSTLLIVMTFLLAAGAYAYNIVVLQAPQRVFWEAISADMSLKGVACTVNKQADKQSSMQTIWLDLAGRHNALVTTTLDQNGTKVTTEDINTPAADFIRYTQVATTVKDKKGHSPDVSKILNVWAKQPRATPSSPTMLGQAALGGCIVPLVDVSQKQQDKLIDTLKKSTVFQTNFAHSKWHWQFEEPYRDYTVTIPPLAYISFMKQVDNAYGVNALPAVSVDAYKDKPGETVMFRIGATTHHIQRIWYTTRNQSFDFSHYNEVPDTAAPNQVISIDELTKRLQTINSQ